jgi:type IV secretion system protein VirD4
MVVLDSKYGENAKLTAHVRQKNFGHDVYFLNPCNYGRFPCHRFNPLARFTPDSPTFVRDADTLAEMLLDDKNPQQSYFADRSRDAASVAIMYVCSGLRVPSDITADVKDLRRVRQLIGQPASMLKTFMAECTKLPIPAIKNRAGRFAEFSDDSKEMQGILGSLEQTKWLDEPNLAYLISADEVDFSKLKDGKTTAYIMLDPELMKTYPTIARLVTGCVMREVMKEQIAPDEEHKRVMFLLDEFSSLGHMNIMPEAIARGRSAGALIFPILQNIGQLKNTYKNEWQDFMENASVQIFFTGNGKETADYITHRAGTMTMSVYSKSIAEKHEGELQPDSRWHQGGGHSYEQRDLLLSQDVYRLPSDRSIIFKKGWDCPILAERKAWFNVPGWKREIGTGAANSNTEFCKAS